MTVNKSFVLLIFLITSGFFLCSSLLTEKELEVRFNADRAMGVHLGATYSSVGVYKHPRPESIFCNPREWQCTALMLSDLMDIVRNEQGSNTMPSCVSFTDSGVLIGEAAKAEEAVNPERTVCGINRLIGKRFDDADVQSYIKSLTYKVLNQENKPYVEVKLKNGETKLFSPVEISAMILGRLKEMAEKHMGNEAELTVILVQQGYFDNEVRRHLEEACKMAGLKNALVFKSAYAIPLARDHIWTRDKFRGLVYDLGGSAFGVALLAHDLIGASLVTAAKGGQTFDTRLVDYFVNLTKSKYNKDVSKNLSALVMLRTECEKAKIRLSSSDQVTVKVDFPLADDEFLHFEEPLTRKMFEELNMDLFNKTIDLVKGVMEEGGLEKTDIDEIILVGGSTQIPMIQHLVKNFFGRELLNVGNPNTALTFSATRIAGTFIGRDFETGGHHVQNSLSVGIETIGGVMTPFVEVDRQLPNIKSINVTTYHDGKTAVEIKVFEGETLSTKYCHYLGSLQLSDIPPVPRGVTTIEVTLAVYQDLDIRVTAEHKSSKKKNSMMIPHKERHTTVEKIRQTYSNVYKCYKEDIEIRDMISSKFQPGADNKTVATNDKIDWDKYSIIF